jgi:hypothetical protein
MGKIAEAFPALDGSSVQNKTPSSETTALTVYRDGAFAIRGYP